MLENRWYPVLESRKLGKKPIGIKRFGSEWALFRDASGTPRMLPAACPHRGANLADGRVVDGELACPWHGFRFAGDGHCTAVPCDGRDARIPRALNLRPLPVREAHDLVFAWWGEARETLPDIPFFEREELVDRGGTTDASYILPYHYSRMVETNLDLHHAPFVHGNVFPSGERVVDFEASLDEAGERISSSGRLIRERDLARGRDRSFGFRADLILPNLVLIELSERTHLAVCATPVDDEHSWMWFRYYQGYTGIKPIGKLITWFAVQSELRVVQKQDWRVFARMTPGTIDDFPYAFVHADKAIALYRKRRAELLAEKAA